jgi:hypothetical protein
MYSRRLYIAFYWKIDLVYKQILYRLNISPKVHRWNLSKLYGTQDNSKLFLYFFTIVVYFVYEHSSSMI